MKALLLGFALLLSSSSMAAVTLPTPEEMQQLVAKAKAMAAEHGIRLVADTAHNVVEKEKISGFEEGNFLLGVMPENPAAGVCRLVYNDHPTDEAAYFFAGISEQDRSAWLEAILVHELAHCREEVLANKDLKKADIIHPLLTEKLGINTLQDWEKVRNVPLAVHWREILADLAMSVHLQQVLPTARWQSLMSSLIQLRAQYREDDPEHDTSRFLQALLANHKEHAGDPFQVALELRARFAREGIR